MQLRGTNVVLDTIAAKKPVISGSGATRTLNELESGSTVLFDRTGGIVYTLPKAAPGVTYDFVVARTSTTGAAKVIANVATSSACITGFVTETSESGAVTPRPWAANGSTHIAISMNGTTTGGQIGSGFRMTAISANTWFISGLVSGTGTFATPFATS